MPYPIICRNSRSIVQQQQKCQQQQKQKQQKQKQQQKKKQQQKQSSNPAPARPRTMNDIAVQNGVKIFPVNQYPADYLLQKTSYPRLPVQHEKITVSLLVQDVVYTILPLRGHNGLRRSRSPHYLVVAVLCWSPTGQDGSPSVLGECSISTYSYVLTVRKNLDTSQVSVKSRGRSVQLLYLAYGRWASTCQVTNPRFSPHECLSRCKFCRFLQLVN